MIHDDPLPMNRFEIRPMEEEDIPEVVPIELACFGERWTASIFYSELANSNATYFVAVLDGLIIGFIGYWLIMEEAHITTLAVLPRYRRHHIAERMLLRVIEHCQAAGCKWMTLEVRKSNAPAQRLYEKYGFKSLGQRRRYYQDNNEDALVMWTENMLHEPFAGRLAELRRRMAETPIEA